MNYTERTLIFEENKIYFIDEVNEEQQVMMNWEDGLMKKHADYVCSNALLSRRGRLPSSASTWGRRRGPSVGRWRCGCESVDRRWGP